MDFEYLKDNALKQAQDWNFGTRINKKDFWSYILVLVVINILSDILFSKALPQLNSLIGLAVNVLMVPVAIRRCHDINKSGWAYGVPMLVLAGMLALMAVLGGAAAVAFITTGGLGAGVSLAGLGAAAVVGMLLVPALIGVTIYLIVLFIKDSYPEENKWGPVPTSDAKSAASEPKKSQQAEVKETKDNK